MKLALLALAVLCTSGPALAQNAQSSPPAIVVVGTGQAEAPPDSFTVSARLIGRGADQVSALRALADTQGRVSGDLQNLEGLDRLTLTTSRVSVSPVASDCPDDRYGDPGSDCAITGYVAAVDLIAKGAPLAGAGSVVSLAAERGAQTVTLDQFDLADPDALDAEASRLAFLDARRQADLIAAASGQSIVRVLRVEDPQNRIGAIQSGAFNEIIVTGSRIRPAVELTLAPPPVVVRKQLSVIFEIQ